MTLIGTHSGSQSSDQQTDRALAALLGVAIGDALGMPSQTLSCAEITSHYGTITDFMAPFEGHPVSHGLVAGAITDDTEQTLLLAERILASPEYFDSTGWARDLLDWEADVKARGLYDFLGPSTKAALKALHNGTPASQTGLGGATNGAAMRISPVAIATPVYPLSEFLDQIEQTCQITHNTSVAMAAATAVATVISLGVDGATFEEAIPQALTAATDMTLRFPTSNHLANKKDLVCKIQQALDLAADQVALTNLVSATGNSVAAHESIPAAFGLVRLAGYNAWDAAVLAANIGDDTDTIGSMAAAMAASCTGTSGLPADKRQQVVDTNHLKLNELVTALLELRHSRSGNHQDPASVSAAASGLLSNANKP